jgi:NAD kinase
MTLSIVVVTRPTRLEGLRARWVTDAQAKFLISRAHTVDAELRKGVKPTTKTRRAAASKAANGEADFAEYKQEDSVYQKAVEAVERQLDFGLPVKRIDRSFVSTFDFRRAALVVVVGQDGLVANTAKYVGGLPIVAVNPDPKRIDGILLPFQVPQVRKAVDRVIKERYHARTVTLAEVALNDGQQMLAFNDFYLGTASHVSARYTLQVDGQQEPQSSSGVLVSTGAGSTGWMSSVINMTAGISHFFGQPMDKRINLEWGDRRLVWAVREPFVSKQSRAGLVAGILKEHQELVVESLMPSGGVIFSDGIEADFLQFNSGTIARIRVADQYANLVVE